MKNALGRFVPGEFVPYDDRPRPLLKIKEKITPGNNEAKFTEDIGKIFDDLDIGDGAVLSFHHHLRNGDEVMNIVMEEILRRKLKNLTFAPSSIFPCHHLLSKLIETGAVTKIYTSYLNGSVAETIAKGAMAGLLIMDTHGGRSYAIEVGDIAIDVAFIAVPAATATGDGNGYSGPAACGSLGYAISDMLYAGKRVVVTDHIVPEINENIIDGRYIDYVLKVPKIGESAKIVSGTTRITRDPIGLLIASNTVKVLKATGKIQEGFSFQTGAGGISLAVSAYLRDYMKECSIKARFASGGITGYIVNMHEEGLIDHLYDVQCFDLTAVRSIASNKNHHEISASVYASPLEENIAEQLDIVILGAAEIDTNFNVNVTTASDGLIIGGSGGHADTACGADVSVIVTPLLKTRLPIVRDHIMSVTTPGKDIDIIVTERGIAVNPARPDLKDRLKKAGLDVRDIKELRDTALAIAGAPRNIKTSDRIVGVIRYRDLSVIDSIYGMDE